MSLTVRRHRVGGVLLGTTCRERALTSSSTGRRSPSCITKLQPPRNVTASSGSPSLRLHFKHAQRSTIATWAVGRSLNNHHHSPLNTHTRPACPTSTPGGPKTSRPCWHGPPHAGTASLCKAGCASTLPRPLRWRLGEPAPWAARSAALGGRSATGGPAFWTLGAGRHAPAQVQAGLCRPACWAARTT